MVVRDETCLPRERRITRPVPTGTRADTMSETLETAGDSQTLVDRLKKHPTRAMSMCNNTQN